MNYQEQLKWLREFSENDSAAYHTPVLSSSVKAVLARLDEVEKALADLRSVTCVYCGHKTDGKNKSVEQITEEINSHVMNCEKRPERKLFAGLLFLAGVVGVTEADMNTVPDKDTNALMLMLAGAIQRHNPAHMLYEWHKTFNVPRLDEPQVPPPDRRVLRLELIREEFEELKSADADLDPVAYADALADLVYVIYGAALEWGIPLDRVVEEVHRSNMTKVWADGTVHYREDGKVLKPPTYSKADVLGVLKKAGFNGTD